MKPPCTWPPTKKLVGRHIQIMTRIVWKRLADGRIVGVRDPGAGMGQFRVLDEAVPYVVMKGAEPGEPGP